MDPLSSGTGPGSTHGVGLLGRPSRPGGGALMEWSAQVRLAPASRGDVNRGPRSSSSGVDDHRSRWHPVRLRLLRERMGGPVEVEGAVRLPAQGRRRLRRARSPRGTASGLQVLRSTVEPAMKSRSGASTASCTGRHVSATGMNQGPPTIDVRSPNLRHHDSGQCMADQEVRPWGPRMAAS